MKLNKTLEILKCQLACERDEGCEKYKYCSDCPNCVSDDEFIQALDAAISALEKQEQDRWIPVSERPPEESGNYLVTSYDCGEKHVEVGLFISCDDGDAFWTSQNVIAWKDKPEPYQEDEA